jgi:hypoxanthine phosphoribosyltransferase
MSKKNKTFISWSEIDKLLDDIERQIKESGEKFDMIAGVTRGGLVPAVMLSHRLELPMMAITTEDAILPISLAKKTLIVDEIYDTGKTIKGLKQVNPMTQFAVLYHNVGLDQLEFYGKKMRLDNWLVFPWE